jgi:hypothetical protein
MNLILKNLIFMILILMILTLSNSIEHIKRKKGAFIMIRFNNSHNSHYSHHTILFLAVLTLIIIISSTHPSAGEKRVLTGNVVGDLGEGEYLVKTVLTVPYGDTLRVSAGAVMYFEQLTGIDVRGALVVSGAPGIPVVMASSNDAAGAAEAAQPFDWNGVRSFGPAAAVIMRHASVSNSVYGVQIWDTLSLAELRDVVFQSNGYASLMRGGEIVPVAADKPVNISWNASAPALSSSSSSRPIMTNPKIRRNPGKDTGTVSAKFIINVSALTVAAAGMTACYVGLSNTNTYNNYYAPEGLSEYYREKIRKNVTVSAIGAAAAGVGLGCIGVTLFF